jgi:hypothetical protein
MGNVPHLHIESPLENAPEKGIPLIKLYFPVGITNSVKMSPTARSRHKTFTKDLRRLLFFGLFPGSEPRTAD